MLYKLKRCKSIVAWCKARCQCVGKRCVYRTFFGSVRKSVISSNDRKIFERTIKQSE